MYINQLINVASLVASKTDFEASYRLRLCADVGSTSTLRPLSKWLRYTNESGIEDEQKEGMP